MVTPRLFIERIGLSLFMAGTLTVLYGWHWGLALAMFGAFVWSICPLLYKD